MKITEQNIGELAEKYLKNDLSSVELNQILEQLNIDEEMKKVWDETIETIQLLEQYGEREIMRGKIENARIQSQFLQDQNAKTQKRSPLLLFRQYGVKVGVAAALILASSFLTYFLVDNKNNHKGEEYMLLRREVETIKNSQSKIWDSLKVKSDVVKETTMPALYGGTGFAVSNDGYVATNYHVVKDANAIYVQTASGNSFKAYLIAFEPNSDVALLKIEDRDFRFGNGLLPYSFAKNISGLGQKVFTIGYPQEELVYNEGYISCENGFKGDSTSYQLEMTANPGQSGAPVLDKNGDIIALITGKQSNTSGKTYAIHSGALVQLIESLPKANNLNLRNTNKLHNLDRTQQVNKLRDYVCAVKVN